MLLCGAAAAAGQQPRAATGSAIVVVRPYGFEPRDVKIPAGNIYLLVQNRSGAAELDLVLSVEHGPQVRSIPMRKHRAISAEMYALVLGTYILQEAHNPAWKCRITVTRK